MELMKFFLVAVVGLMIDTGIAWVLSQRFSVSMTLSSVSGFLFAAIMNYLMHELWTFKHGHRKLSKYRAFTYIWVLILALGTRVLVVHALQILLTPTEFALVILLIAACASFLVNFIASKFFVFKTSSTFKGRIS